jgi:hypothetical protein
LPSARSNDDDHDHDDDGPDRRAIIIFRGWIRQRRRCVANYFARGIGLEGFSAIADIGDLVGDHQGFANDQRLTTSNAVRIGD